MPARAASTDAAVDPVAARHEPPPAWPRSAAIALGVGATVAGLVYDPAAPAAMPKTVVLLLVAIAGLSLSWARPREDVVADGEAGLPRAVALWITLCAWGALSATWGNLARALPILGAWVGAASLMLVASRMRAETRVELARRVALLVGSGAAALVALQWAWGARGLHLHGGQGNPNWLGLLLALTLPPTVELVLARRPRWPLWAALALLQLAALGLSGARAAWLALAATALLFGLRHALRRRSARGLLLALAAVALLASAALLVRGEKPLGAAWAGRVQIWRVTVVAALPTLLWGAGLGDFGHVYLEAQGRSLATLPPPQAARRFLNATSAHNDWLQLLLEGGLVALGLWALALWVALRDTWRAWPAGAASLVACGLVALGDAPLGQPAVLVVLALIFAAGPCRPVPVLRALPGRAGRAVALAAVALLLAPAVASWLGARTLSGARDAVLGQRLTLLQHAARRDPRSGEIALELGLAQLESGQGAGQAVTELRRSARLLANVGTHVALGNALLRRGELAAATSAYRQALAWHPGSFRAHANLAEALRRQGQLERAAWHLRVARRLLPGHPRLGELERRLRHDQLERASGAPPGPVGP